MVEKFAKREVGNRGREVCKWPIKFSAKCNGKYRIRKANDRFVKFVIKRHMGCTARYGADGMNFHSPW